ncbi:DeoR/GlpR family DNA-binding transcription regulator [Microbacterium rhizosphaerae]|uniref:Lactose phosphotransferase system repressor n=1 Tax=Microbacterium rhizosphaerae TaxID=1678237 RepID=A0ABZ0SJG4_9MICO|nr:DeoR/GlpR family DNA-binding transcription regulator [Microbacterium rhizosphaerae]WPR89502.1 DeoR/GlpR family DNA-binding transcription regulator [Microbacterium rhizosphaerae]
MYATERQKLVEQLLARQGRVAVVELAGRFDVTTETVRRDLDALERQGALVRVHGGAVLPERASTTELTLVERAERRSDDKQAIARRALDVLPEGFSGSIYVDAGTTTAAVAELLPARLAAIHGRADVVTHSLTVASALAGDPDVSLTLIGGRVRGVTAAAVGASTVAAIEGLRPDISFVGTNGVSADFGLSTPDPDEAAVKRAIVRSARRVVVVADSSKQDRDLLTGFASLYEVDVLVTDAAPEPALAHALAAADVEVSLA